MYVQLLRKGVWCTTYALQLYCEAQVPPHEITIFYCVVVCVTGIHVNTRKGVTYIVRMLYALVPIDESLYK